MTLQDGKTVVLIFAIHGSSQFNGVARVTNIVPVSAAKDFLAPGIPATLQLEWWKKSVIHTFHIFLALKQPGLT